MAFVRLVSQLNGSGEGDSDGTVGPPIKELYRFSDGYKCYWLHRGDAQIWALFDAATARSRLRVICEATLALLLPDGKNA